MEPTDQELLAATAAGDGEAFAMFWRRHTTAVMAFGIHRCATSEDVADLVGDTFRAAGRYRAETTTAAPWLLGIATRLASDQQRRLARWLRVSRRGPGSLRASPARGTRPSKPPSTPHGRPTCPGRPARHVRRGSGGPGAGRLCAAEPHRSCLGARSPCCRAGCRAADPWPQLHWPAWWQWHARREPG
jgi:hypothetical protein